MKDRALRHIYTLFLIIFVVIALIALWAVRSINRSARAADWVNHTYATIYEIDNVLSALSLGDGAVRTYVTTGDTRDLVATREAFSGLSDHWAAAKALVRDDPGQTQEMLRLEQLTGWREDFARALWTAHDAGQMDKVRELLKADAASTANAEIKRGLNQLRQKAYEALSEQDHASFVQAQTTRWVVGVGVVLDLLLFLAVAWLIRDDIATRQRLADSLQAANDQLESKVRERSLQLIEANQNLTTENLERKWANQALEHQLRYNQLIVNSVGDLVLVMTKVQSLTRINPAVTHHTGFEERDLLGQPIGTLVRLEPNAEGAAAGADAIARALHEGRDFCGQKAWISRQGGAPVPAVFNLFPLRDGNKVVGGVAILRPVEATRP
ncbi:MAG: CHASE3 domain-containing protein [Opitutales bacterium]